MSTLAQRLARADAISECISLIAPIIDDVDDPGPIPDAMLAALFKLRDSAQAVIQQTEPIDYLGRARVRAQNDFRAKPGPADYGWGAEDTPLGRLKVRTWQRTWVGKLGSRIVWASEYLLDGDPVTIADLRKAGFARRPHSRNRKARSAEI